MGDDLKLRGNLGTLNGFASFTFGILGSRGARGNFGFGIFGIRGAFGGCQPLRLAIGFMVEALHALRRL
jgi:hypothetical protein